VQPDARTAEPDAPAVLPTCETRTAQPENATWTLTVDGSQRTARIHVPPGYKPSERTPVVLNLHGLNSNATHQEYLSKMIAKSNAEGFIAVHPQGKGNSWNAGSCCGTASSTNVDDIKFLSALLDELEAKLCVDPDRVYATGLSNGGHMAHRLGCELSERIAAIAPVAGLKMFAACAPERAVPVFAVHGDDDGIVSYSFVPATINYWKNHNACTSTQTTSQNGDATCVTHGNCTGGADVELCTIANGGHQWPGGYAIVGLGIKSDDLIATDAIWSFFVAHPRGAL
jgi:polyhydroxybutyrate depolymerase